MNMTTLSLGISTCPNDTFIFGALAQGRVCLEGIDLGITLADVEELNRWAGTGGPDIVKVSVAAVAGILDEYWLLRAGGAMGYGVGPLLLGNTGMELNDLAGARVAIPGRHTTANLLLGLLLREQGIEVELVEMVFDQIMEAVKSGSVRAGLVIHEGRFTYEKQSLVKLVDLGQWWEQSRKLPIPLGAIAIRRSLGLDVAAKVNRGIYESLFIARGDESAVWPYVKHHAQEMCANVVLEHIRTFVTAYSLDVGEDGENAVAGIVAESCRAMGRALPSDPIFAPIG
ncbi:MAG: 1,4-dihydroxy-6-naphthoate synthase [Proteobacteria bacterium]|nr:1,4-dihydroxy-6-naphthoate synthase [Pseudomonadota bacterium]